jgi:hypothetical protein
MSAEKRIEPSGVAHAGRPDAPVEALRRWEDSGAGWRVLSRTPSGVVIALMRCDGGEEVDRLVSTDPELLTFVGTRTSSED